MTGSKPWLRIFLWPLWLRLFAGAYLIALIVSFAFRVFSPVSAFPSFFEQSHMKRRFADLPAVNGKGELLPGNYRLAYGDQGSGDVLILIHGSPGSADNFSKMVPILAKKYRVIVPDMPGFGDSTGYALDYGPISGARLILELMDHLNIRKASILGYSYGGAVAQYAVHFAPERFTSLILYGAIGVQEREGSGNYHIEHLKYALGFPFLVYFPELLPHFGILGSFHFRYAFLRNFWDLDQRPLRSLLTSISLPVLILHGEKDFLVPVEAAREHQRLIRSSSLRVYPYGHVMPFVDNQAKILSSDILFFLSQSRSNNEHLTPDDLDSHRSETFANKKRSPGVRVEPGLPLSYLESLHSYPMAMMTGIVLATFVSEDITLVSVGMLIESKKVDPFLGMFASFIGIFVGDLGLYFLGILSARLVTLFPLRHLTPDSKHLLRIKLLLERNGGKMILISRFLPGTRTFTYLAAGFFRVRPISFFLWALLAGAIWAPLLILLATLFGSLIAKPFIWMMGANVFSTVLIWICVLWVVHSLSLLISQEGRYRCLASLQRVYRWEFWPMKVFYIPVAIYLIWKTIQYRSFTVFTAVNPSIPDGGVVGESKFEILKNFPSILCLSPLLLPADAGNDRYGILEKEIQSGRLDFPLILKPDRSQRGASVKLISGEDEAREYLDKSQFDVLAQRYHPGPMEAGILYYRLPDEKRGHIFSITEKRFPRVLGDGQSTLRKLILQHPRYRMQRDIFFKRYPEMLENVPDAGQEVRLAVAGNHCQGTLFRDGSQWITEKLTDALDRLADHMDGFYMGRFDVRYESAMDLREGKNLYVVELNGALGESTNIYDPDWHLWQAYRTLFRQIDLLYEIGSRNIRHGARPTPLLRLAGNILYYYRNLKIDALSD